MKEQMNFKGKVINFALHNRTGNLILRFIKYNLVGSITFLVGTLFSGLRSALLELGHG